MKDNGTVNLQQVYKVRNTLERYRDDMYMNMIVNLNTESEEILKDDLGSYFVRSCRRDLAGEVVRNFFDTSDFNITVDQMAERILKFSYEDEYDPLRYNSAIKKDVYNYNDFNSKTLNEIVERIDNSQKKLFVKVKDEKGERRYVDQSMITQQKQNYVEDLTADGDALTDSYSGMEGEYVIDKNGKIRRRLQVEHSQSLGAATFNERYIKEKGIDNLKLVYNSEANFSIMVDTANQIKSDVRVCINEKGKIEYMKGDALEVRQKKAAETGETSPKDITHRATPAQYSDAVVSQWENTKDPQTRQKLIDTGYLDENGKVPKHIRNKLKENIRRSQNAESIVILKNAKYEQVGADAFVETKKSIGKIVAGQLIYYATPPIVYEVQMIVKDKPASLDAALDRIGKASKRIGNYVFSHLKDMFSSIIASTLKKFIKTFMDILINLVKATIKRIMKLVKNLVLATVDAVKIIRDKNATTAQKADSVCNLFGVTLTTFAVDVLFEYLADGLHIPNFLLNPLQILVTVICTNLTMLILQKADLFDVRFGFMREQIRKKFNEAREEHSEIIGIATDYVGEQNAMLIEHAKEECMSIYENMREIDPNEFEVRGDLETLNTMFNMNVDFDSFWQRLMGKSVDVP